MPNSGLLPSLLLKIHQNQLALESEASTLSVLCMQNRQLSVRVHALVDGLWRTLQHILMCCRERVAAYL
jgi:hypothetical protein